MSWERLLYGHAHGILWTIRQTLRFKFRPRAVRANYTMKIIKTVFTLLQTPLSVLMNANICAYLGHTQKK